MNSTKLHRKYGIVILLDALGASEYSDEKIKEFLKARTEIHEIIKSLAASSKKVFGSEFKKACPPSIFTFGDTIIITIELRS
ncbi:MAG TPA: hypothetical protein VK811_04990, partial [Candidatus Acidoferrum sp.]|nr:hypothetical protein [Candidatus Acidoferrum sp.]